jgi:hypothetical protein
MEISFNSDSHGIKIVLSFSQVQQLVQMAGPEFNRTDMYIYIELRVVRSTLYSLNSAFIHCCSTALASARVSVMYLN